MPVNADQLAAFRTLLTGENEENQRLQQKLDQSDGWEGYGALISAGFVMAAERWFDKPSDTDIVEYVASVRSRSDELGEKIDPVIAERLIKAMHSDETIDDIDPTPLIGTQLVLLVALIHDAQLDDAELEAFLAEAKGLADQWVDEAP